MAMVNQHPVIKKWILRLWNFWPPFFGAGIHVRSVTDDLRHFEVSLKLHFWNKNFFGTQYGGSLFSMTDTFKIDDQTIAEIKNNLSDKEKMDWIKTVEIKDIHGEVVAEVDKVVYIRRKKKTS